ncbi:DUF6527 family protein [Confluentibacter sediminis]|uniref:DUF6527 family protein n=1 Tax=Confluentibacter sediminis TaxID=2219045 RepID=UPI000DAC5192
MFLTRLFNWFFSLFKLKKISLIRHYKLIIVPELPENPNEKTLYVEGNKILKDYWYALLICPCGCKEKIMLNLMDDAKPCWTLKIKKSDFSISPSIWRTKNCKSHFWLRNRKIIWA